MRREGLSLRVASDQSQVFGREAVGSIGVVSRLHDLGQIHDGVARHVEGPLGLLSVDAVNSGHDQRGRIENDGERAEPGLIAVLRAEKAQHGIRKMAFEHFGGPALPVAKELVETALVRTAGGAGSNSAAVGGDPARASSREISISRRENDE